MYFISPKISLAETVKWVQMLKEDTEKFKFPEALRGKKKAWTRQNTLHALTEGKNRASSTLSKCQATYTGETLGMPELWEYFQLELIFH